MSASYHLMAIFCVCLQIISGGVIIISDELQMYSRNKLFSVALSRDMAPSARILAYLIAPDGQVVADSLNFHVNGSKLHQVRDHCLNRYRLSISPVINSLLCVGFIIQMSVKFNRGKDFSYNTVEITATADPLSYVAFSAIEYQLYELGAKNGLTWEEVCFNNGCTGFTSARLKIHQATRNWVEGNFLLL